MNTVWEINWFSFSCNRQHLALPYVEILSQLPTPISSIVKSTCNDWQLSTDLISLYNFESSAYKAEFVLDDKLSGRSFIDIAKSNGPTMLPCGTLDETGDHEDAASSMTTLCCLSFK